MEPVNWHPPICIYRRFDNDPSEDGNEPLRSLSPKRNHTNLERLPNSDGTGPLRWLRINDRYWRSARLPSEAGIEPVNWLYSRSSDVSLSRFPREDGMEPDKLFCERSISTTRFEDITTPNHLLTGPESQFVLIVQFTPFVELNRSTNASESWVVTCDLLVLAVNNDAARYIEKTSVFRFKGFFIVVRVAQIYMLQVGCHKGGLTYDECTLRTAKLHPVLIHNYTSIKEKGLLL